MKKIFKDSLTDPEVPVLTVLGIGIIREINIHRTMRLG